MRYEEIKHSNDIAKDIREIFLKEIHSLVFITKKVYETLITTPGFYNTNRNLDCCHHYDDETVQCFEKTLDCKAPFGASTKVTDTIGIVHETGNLYMITYFHSIYVNINLIDEYHIRNNHFLATTDDIKKIVILK